MDTGGACTAAAGRCVQLLCPNVCELTVHARDLDSSFFGHVRLCHSLTKVTICTPYDNADGCGDVLRSLAELPSLRTLEVEGILYPQHIDLLGTLTGLEALRAGGLVIAAAPEHGSRLGEALASLMRLTQLIIPSCGSDDPGGQVTDAAMEKLLPLHRLSALSLGSKSGLSPVLGAGFAALCQMSALTRLACPAASGQAPVVGGSCLPLLQHLRIRSSTTGEELAAMLQRLQPLSQLRSLTCTLPLEEDGNDDFQDDADGRAMAAAWQAATLIAAAPRLQHLRLTLSGSDSIAVSLTGPATAFLTPLRDRLVHLRLTCLASGALNTLLPLLCLAGSLQKLSVQDCRLAATWLPLVAQHLTALRRLQVDECDGVTAASAVALAAVRVHPLHVVWDNPELTEAEYQEFRAAARAGVTVGCDWVNWDDGTF